MKIIIKYVSLCIALIFICFALLSFLCLGGVKALFVLDDLNRGITPQERQEASEGAKRVLSDLIERVGQLPTPDQTRFISEHVVGNLCCGQGESSSTWPMVTRLYESTLTKEEIEFFYEQYKVGIYYVDEAIEQYPDRIVNLPCYPFNLFTGHEIPDELPKDRILYIITASDRYSPPNPKIKYCD